MDAFQVGALIALYERAVGFYGSLVNVNAYHQPGVEVGKKAATRILQLQPKVLAQLSDKGRSAREVAQVIEADPEDVYHVLAHLAANDPSIKTSGDEPGTEKFSRPKLETGALTPVGLRRGAHIPLLSDTVRTSRRGHRPRRQLCAAPAGCDRRRWSL